MKREDVRKFYREATSTLSTVTRQLALAGIAVIWLVRTGDSSRAVHYSPALGYALLLYVAAVGADLMHYAYQSAAWGIFNIIQEVRRIPADKEFLAPGYINWIALWFFWAKVLLTIIGYLIVLYVFGGQLFRVG